jgi:3-hydroxypropanoate dehydrogenase
MSGAATVRTRHSAEQGPAPSGPSLPDLLALDPAAQDLLFRSARTANTFTDEPVTPEQIRAVHELIRYGPTAYNSQPLRIVLIRSTAARDRLLPHLSSGNRAKTGAAPLVAILAADSEFHEHLPRLNPDRPHVRDYYTGPENDAARLAQARFNAAVQIGYFIVGVRAAGLAAGPMAGFRPAGVDAEFFPDGRLRSLLVVNLGRPGPDAWADRLPRLPADDVVHTL